MAKGDNFTGNMVLECPKCNHEWFEHFKLPMRIDVFVSRAKGTNICPKCGNTKKIYMLVGERYRQAIDKYIKVSTHKRKG